MFVYFNKSWTPCIDHAFLLTYKTVLRASTLDKWWKKWRRSGSNEVQEVLWLICAWLIILMIGMKCVLTDEWLIVTTLPSEVRFAIPASQVTYPSTAETNGRNMKFFFLWCSGALKRFFWKLKLKEREDRLSFCADVSLAKC